MGEVASGARLAKATERGHGAQGVDRVDRHGADAERAGDTVGTAEVARPDGSREPVARVICQPYGLRLVVKANYREDGSEHLLACESGSRVNAREDGRLDEAVARADREPFAACDEPS